jgi:hypothetical protein
MYMPWVFKFCRKNCTHYFFLHFIQPWIRNWNNRIWRHLECWTRYTCVEQFQIDNRFHFFHE